MFFLQALLERGNQFVALGDDLVLDGENFLPQTSLLALQLRQFALDAVLLLQGDSLAGVALQLCDACLGVLQCLLCGQQFVVSPAFQLVPFFIEEALVGFQHPGNGCGDCALAVGQQCLGHGGAQRRGFACGWNGHQLFAGFLIQHLTIVGETGEQQRLGRLEGGDFQPDQRQPAGHAAQSLDDGDPCAVFAIVELQGGDGRCRIQAGINAPFPSGWLRR